MWLAAVSPFAGLADQVYLKNHIKKSISEYKKRHPHMTVGETHCHSKHSDGTYTNRQILQRAASLGLDYILITEHLTPKSYPLERIISSFEASWNATNQWEDKIVAPPQILPAFELSTEQGHLVMVFDKEWLHPNKHAEFNRCFSDLDHQFISMERAAERTRKMGGITIIAHPNTSQGRFPFGVDVSFVKQYLTGGVDGIEDISTAHGIQENHSTSLDMASVGSSDDHFNFIVGTSATVFDSRRHKDIMSAIRAKETRAEKMDKCLDPIFTTVRQLF